MLFAVTATYESGNMGTLVKRFVEETEKGEFDDMTLVARYHSLLTKWACLIIETDSVESLHLWSVKFNDLVDFDIHPVVTDEGVAPIVDALMERYS